MEDKDFWLDIERQIEKRAGIAHTMIAAVALAMNAIALNALMQKRKKVIK